MNPLVVFIQRREILSNLVNKQLKAKYAGSFLGMLWAFINPLLLAFIVSFVFTNIFKMNAKNFYLFVISGMLPWSFFSGSLQEAALSIPNNAALLKQFSLPKAFIPIAVVLANFMLLLFGLAVVWPFFIMADPHVLYMVPFLLAALVFLLFFTVGWALLLSAFCVGVRDINQGLNTFLLFWLWLTPVFYTADMVPQEYSAILHFNPINPFLGLFRKALLDSGVEIWSGFLMAAMVSILLLSTGLVVFYKKEGGFLKQI